MKTWTELKKELTSISKEEMAAIDAISHLEAERITRSASQTGLLRTKVEMQLVLDPKRA